MASDAADPRGPALPSSPGRPPPGPLSSPVQVDVAGLSHSGKVRPNNEDHFLVLRFGRFLEPLATNLPAGQAPPRCEDVGYALAVADGMGGHAAGEEASKLALTTLVNLVLNTPDWFLRMDEASSAEEVMRRAAERFGRIDQALAEEAVEDPRLHGLGTTLTLAASLGGDLLLAHVGDSRASCWTPPTGSSGWTTRPRPRRSCAARPSGLGASTTPSRKRRSRTQSYTASGPR